MSEASVPITELLQRWRGGEADAERALMAAIYPVLRNLARARLNRQGGDLTLDSTELANEAYAKLVRVKGTDWQSRVHFFAVAAQALRALVVDHLRARGSEKRGGGQLFIPLDEVDRKAPASLDLGQDWLTVHDLLLELEARDAVAARIVELRVFAGFSVEEMAEACQISVATVGRHWRFAKAWLARRLAA